METKQVKIDGRKISISWEKAVGLEAPMYEVFWDRGETGLGFERLGETAETSFDLNTQPPACSFQFKVRAKIQAIQGHCEGDFSDEMTVGV